MGNSYHGLGRSVPGAEEMSDIPLQIAARVLERLDGRVVAYTYLLGIGLAEAYTVWAEPGLGFVFHSLVLAMLLLQAAFDPEDEVRRLCLALALIPLIRIMGFSLPWGDFDPLSRHLILTTAALAAVGVVIRYLALRPAQIGLGLGKEPFGLVGYLPVVLMALPVGLIEYKFLEPLPLIDRLTPIPSIVAMEVASLGIGFAETLIFYGIVLHVSRDVLGDRASVLYVALLFGVLQIGYLSWQYGVLAFTTSVFYGWAVLKTRTIYAVSLAQGFTMFYVLLAPLLLAR
jgi:membrane protease YdiL (CAAX protease family)